MNKRIVTALYVYPVKSLGGISCTSAMVEEKGFEFDRRWMLVDDNNVCMTQRVYPKMALFKPAIEREGLVIRFENESLEVPATPESSLITARVWNDDVKVFEVSREHSHWFSARLRTHCRFVFFPERNPRAVAEREHQNVSLADAYPFLVIGESSLADLNSRMKKQLPMNRFRPNIVFAGGEPYEEDHWGAFTVGTNRFEGVRPCSRCVLTTVDQDKGSKDGIEPLATLATYRKWDNGVWFGENAIPVDLGEVRLGDEIVTG